MKNDEQKTGYTGGQLTGKNNKQKVTDAKEYLLTFPDEYPMSASAQWRAGYIMALERSEKLLNGND
jgi:hypothetical protein